MAFVALALAAPPALAAPCDTLPEPVLRYIDEHVAVELVRLNDLVASDRKLWTDTNQDACPGFAAVNLDASGRPSYAMGLIDIGPDERRRQQLVLLRPGPRGYRPVVLDTVKLEPEGAWVLWRSPPGRTWDWQDRHAQWVAHESVVFSKLEATAIQYWWAGGRFHTLKTAE